MWIRLHPYIHHLGVPTRLPVWSVVSTIICGYGNFDPRFYLSIRFPTTTGIRGVGIQLPLQPFSSIGYPAVVRPSLRSKLDFQIEEQAAELLAFILADRLLTEQRRELLHLTFILALDTFYSTVPVQTIQMHGTFTH